VAFLIGFNEKLEVYQMLPVENAEYQELSLALFVIIRTSRVIGTFSYSPAKAVISAG